MSAVKRDGFVSELVKNVVTSIVHSLRETEKGIIEIKVKK